MLAALRLSCLVALILPALAQATPPGGLDVIEEFDIGRDGGPITLPVTVGGRTFRFMVVTAAAESMFDVSLRSSPENGGIRSGVEQVSGFVVGRHLHHASTRPIALMDMERVRQRSGLEVHGVLGMDFLSKYVVRIDFDSGRLTFLRRPGRDPGSPIPLKQESGIPIVEGDVAGSPGKRLRINTGDIRSHSGSLDQATCDRLAHSGKWYAFENRTQAADGLPKAKEGRLESLKIGPFAHRGLYFAAAAEPGALGLGFLRRYSVTFDFPAGVLYLRPSSRHSLPDQLPCSGLHVLRRSGKTVVDFLDEGSPAASAGIHPGDEVISINGTEPGPGGFAVLGQLLKGEGRTVQVVIRRDGEILELPLHLDSSWRLEKQGR